MGEAEQFQCKVGTTFIFLNLLLDKDEDLRVVSRREQRGSF